MTVGLVTGVVEWSMRYTHIICVYVYIYIYINTQYICVCATKKEVGYLIK